MTQDRFPMPSKITRANIHDVKIFWEDGHESLYEARLLRLKCRCALCIEEISGRKILEDKAVAPGVHPLSIQPVGRYGIQIQWSDGHNTGIYSFNYLRRICPCPSCVSSH